MTIYEASLAYSQQWNRYTRQGYRMFRQGYLILTINFSARHCVSIQSKRSVSHLLEALDFTPFSYYSLYAASPRCLVQNITQPPVCSVLGSIPGTAKGARAACAEHSLTKSQTIKANYLYNPMTERKQLKR